jgi:hypothetical protein
MRGGLRMIRNLFYRSYCKKLTNLKIFGGSESIGGLFEGQTV